MSEIVGELFDQPILRVTRVEGYSAILDPCPFCGKTHTHGNGRDWRNKPPEYKRALGKGTSVPSHRQAHCAGSTTGYFLIYTEETEGLEDGENGLEYKND